MRLHRRGLLLSAASACLAAFTRPLGARMIEPKTIAEQLMYSTARIVGYIPNSTNIKTGSGFFFNFPTDDGQQVPVLFTNKHVIEDTERLEFLIHTTTKADQTSPNGNAAISSHRADWVLHQDPKTDLCALVVGPVLNSMAPLFPFFRAIDPGVIKSDEQLKELNAVEDILMIGYPNGLWDPVNNFPLIRRGITASHPAVDFDVNGVATTVVDVACFPGSSGSPVFIYNEGSYGAKGGGVVVGSRLIFLGVLYSGPIFQPDGSIVVKNIPTVNVPVPVVNMMMNLGYIIKAKQVIELGAAIFAKHGLKGPAIAPQSVKAP